MACQGLLGSEVMPWFLGFAFRLGLFWFGCGLHCLLASLFDCWVEKLKALQKEIYAWCGLVSVKVMMASFSTWALLSCSDFSDVWPFPTCLFDEDVLKLITSAFMF